jgi:hypothetical protein
MLEVSNKNGWRGNGYGLGLGLDDITVSFFS